MNFHWLGGKVASYMQLRGGPQQLVKTAPKQTNSDLDVLVVSWPSTPI